MRKRYLTFDCYGTLIDWKKGIEDNFIILTGNPKIDRNDIFDRYTVLESGEERHYTSYREILKETFLKLTDEFKLHPPKKAADNFADSISRWPVFQDSQGSLKKLGELGYKRIILSNIDTSLLQESIRKNKLEVDGYVTAQEVKSYKPDKGHWREFLKRYNTRIDETIHVAGSLYHDIVPASEMGFETVWINRYQDPVPGHVSPSFITKSLSDVLNVL